MRTIIDINCDVGEGFGAYGIGEDEQLLRWVSSANIACGFHAGDPKVMRKTVLRCLERGVSIGAHPGLPDLQGFGRRVMAVPAEEIYEMTLYQIGALHTIANAEGGRLSHVKPHGALYHMAESDPAIAEAIAKAVLRSGLKLALVGLSGGRLVQAGVELGVAVRRESFADRAYKSDGGLVSRAEPGALLHDPGCAARQALSLARDGVAETSQGAAVPVTTDTICVHGDHPGAAERAKTIYETLVQAGFRIASE